MVELFFDLVWRSVSVRHEGDCGYHGSGWLRLSFERTRREKAALFKEHQRGLLQTDQHILIRTLVHRPGGLSSAGQAWQPWQADFEMKG